MGSKNHPTKDARMFFAASCDRLLPAGFRLGFCSLLNPGLREKDPPRATPAAFFGSVMPVPIAQPKPTDKPREFGAAGACPAGGGVSEPTHSVALREKQLSPRRAELGRAGGGKNQNRNRARREGGGSLFFIPRCGKVRRRRRNAFL